MFDRSRVSAVVLVLLLGCGPLASAAQGDAPPRGKLAWTLEEAKEQLKLYRRDPYLQYVVMQLGLRDGHDLSSEISTITRGRNAGGGGGDAGREVDLFNLFTGALAVQESLQLDTMRPESPQRAGGRSQGNGDKQAKLSGPAVQSHPWEQMLGGRKPDVSALSRCVPAEFYFAEFRSVSKLLDVVDSAGLWAEKLSSEAMGDATWFGGPQRVRKQFGLQIDPMLRPFYDEAVSEVAITGSDLFLREGSDVTMIFRLKQPQLFRARLEALLVEFQKSTPGAERVKGDVNGMPYVEVTSPDRRLSVYAADPAPDLHVRSNSEAGLARVLAIIKGGGAGSLGESAEFAYIRTLMPVGAAQEDGLLYLSDPFIRRLVGPTVKLTERRRMICYNHLRMMAHARMLYRTDFGKEAGSLKELSESGCAPGEFGQGKLACPDGGQYSLDADGVPVCSVHGRMEFMTPCLELPLENVTAEESEQYRQFVEGYNQYWRRYFDPIAIRIAVTPENCRFETIILPLIDNSIYTGLARTLGGGPPEALDALPVPARTIFSVNVRLKKEALLHELEGDPGLRRNWAASEMFGAGITDDDFHKFVNQGLGGQFGLHVYDAAQMFGFDMPGFVGEATRTFSGVGGRGGGFETEVTLVSALIASLNAPVYVSMPVKDAKVVDEFFTKADAGLAASARLPPEGGFIWFSRDFYALPEQARAGATPIRCHVLHVGPLTWRFFWQRIGNGLYIASKAFILDDLAKASVPPAEEQAETSGHAMLRVRPEHWEQVLADYRLQWAEKNRAACLDNLGPLSDAARAASAAGAGWELAAAQRLYGVQFYCPDGGTYQLAADGKSVACSVHGTAREPKQSRTPGDEGKTLYGAAGVTATLTFMEDGLHAVVNVKRK